MRDRGSTNDPTHDRDAPDPEDRAVRHEDDRGEPGGESLDVVSTTEGVVKDDIRSAGDCLRRRVEAGRNGIGGRAYSRISVI